MIYFIIVSNQFTMTFCMFQIPLGMGMAASIRVGQFLGAGQALHAKNATRVAFSIVFEY